MKTNFALLPILWLVLTAVAAAKDTASAVTVPESIVVPSGGTGYLVVKFDRKLLRDKLDVSLEQLPKGLAVVDKPPAKSVEKDDGDTILALLASESVPAGDLGRLQLIVAGPDLQIKKSVDIKIVQFGMRPLSWLVMSVSVSAVLILVSFCVWRVLTLPPVEEETLKGPLEIDTRDTDNAD